jgi:riboflavin synthase
MFTGLVEEMGRVAQAAERGGLRCLVVEASATLEDLRSGDSIALDGVCLTAVDVDRASFAVEAVPETLKRTTLGALHPGDYVNLERPMRVCDRLGGHFVLGHIDGVARVVARREQGADVMLDCALPDGLVPYVVEKGSIALAGVSLTVAALQANRLSVALIPETLRRTTLGVIRPARDLNVEVDVLAKHVAQLLTGWRVPEPALAGVEVGAG